MGLRHLLATRRARRRHVLSLCVLAAAAATLAGAPSAFAAACAGGTVTPMHSPDGSTRPLYGDWAGGSTKHSGYVGYELASGLATDLWIKLSGFTGGSVGLAANQSASIPARATSVGGKPLVYAYLTASAATTTAQSWTVEVWNGKPGQAGSTQVCTATDGASKVIDVISANANKITSISLSSASPAIGGGFDATAVGDTGTMGQGDAADRSGGNGVFSMAPAMDDNWPADAFMLTGVRVTIGGSTFRDRLRIYPGTAAAGAYTAIYSFSVRKAPSSATAVYPVQNIASGTQVKYTGSYPSTTTSIAVPTVTTSLVKSTQSLTGPPYKVTYKVVVSNSSGSATVLDYLRDTPTAASWSFATGTATLDGSAIADPSNDAGTLIFAGPFTVPAASGGTAGTRTFLYTLNVGGSVSNSVVGQVGDVSLGGSNAGDNQVTVDPTVVNIATTSLPGATTGSAYSQTLAAVGGTPPYTWTIASGSLPAGLTLNAFSGAIAGTPLVAGSSTFSARVTDGLLSSATKTFTITTSAPAPAPDSIAPTGGLAINGGAAVATTLPLTLDLSATDATGVTRYRVAEGSDCSGASWQAITSATSYSASVSFAPSAGEGTKTICVQYGDEAGNISSTSTASIVYDRAPTVALSSAAANPTNGSFTVTATFSEAVTGFTLADITVGNGSASNLAGSGDAYTFTVTVTADGTVTVDVGAGAAVDSAGSPNSAATQLSRTYDGTRPSVVLSSASTSPLRAAFSVTATFSEAVTGFTLADLTLGNGTAGNLAGSGTTYTFDVTPTADGTVTVDLAADAATDTAGNGNTAATRLSRTYDATRPSVVLSSASTSPLRAGFSVTVTFSEAVTGFTLADLTLGNGTAGNLTGSGTTYTFDVTPTADGTVTVDLAADAATDTAGNGNTAATRLSRTYDATRPSVALSSSAADPVNGAFTVTATFSEAVTGLTLSDLTLVNATAGNLTGSGTTYGFTLTPGSDGTVSATLPAGSVLDAAGNDNTASNTLSRVAATPATPATPATKPAPKSDGALPTASVEIISKMTAKDMIGRPQPYVTAADTARSKGPFTRKLDVALRVPTPENAGDVVYISNYPDFRDERVFPIAADELYDWNLLAGPSGDRPVWTRFSKAPGAGVGVATIVLDQELPKLAPRFVRVGRVAGASPTKPSPKRAACGGTPRRWLSIGGADRFSGLNAVQVASDPTRPCAWRPFLPRFSYRLPGRVIYVRVADRVGNISAWYRIRTPR